MAPPSDDQAESLDGQVPWDVDPGGRVEGSLGERSTGADLESAASDGPRSLGDQSTAGDMGEVCLAIDGRLEGREEVATAQRLVSDVVVE